MLTSSSPTRHPQPARRHFARLHVPRLHVPRLHRLGAVTLAGAAMLSVGALIAPAASAVPPSPAQRSPAVPKYEPLSYDTDPHTYPVRVAKPSDSGLAKNGFGDVGVAWWWFKNPKNPAEMYTLVEAEPFWGPRAVGRGGPVVWGLIDWANSPRPQFPFLNGIISFNKGLPLGLSATWATADGKPGMRSPGLNFNYRPASNSWAVDAQSPLASAHFTATDPVPGSHGVIQVGGNPQTDSLMDEIVVNSAAHGSLNLAGRRIDVNGWRVGYWRMRIVGSAFDSGLNPFTNWSGWEYSPVMEPDGGASEFYGIINHQGRYSGPLIDARPKDKGGTRICSKSTLAFEKYRYGQGIIGPITPPFTPFTIPKSITVTCAPGQPYHFSKTFYPDYTGYVGAGLLDFTEVPVHTVPGSFGTYEHPRWAQFKLRTK
ncbi:hypothetical protein [Gordonia shandongensis]|uniref:hypothetical protein n=1 Tax=Gordonia shandongensis TaxID=376351 RepID=UPI00040B8654|nr:hypothetical protein [Gordonia shandongensis]